MKGCTCGRSARRRYNEEQPSYAHYVRNNLQFHVYVLVSHRLSIHRDRNVFSEDTDLFRPERWPDENRAKEIDITFEGDNRTCAGEEHFID